MPGPKKQPGSSLKRKLGMLGIALILILFGTSISALEIPRLRGRVNDNAGLLSRELKNELEAYLAELERSGGVQIVLLTIPSLSGENLESYSLRVAEEWELGSKEDDSGVLLLVALDERAIRIEVGYGLESVLTDVKSGFIIRDIIVPEFKKGNYGEGIAAGLRTIGEVVSGNLTITAEQIENSEKNGGGIPIFALIFFTVFIIGSIGRRHRRRGVSPLGAFFVGSMLGSASRGGSTSRGFGGGGGFSGGGGGFGGGGASGGW